MGPLRRWVSCHVAYPLMLTWMSARRGGTWRPMRRLRELDALSRAEPRAWQAFRDEQLRRCLANALEHIPLYRGLPADLRELVRDNPMQALRQFPIVTKRDMQERGQELLADYEPPGGRATSWTSGSTGQPTQYWVDRRRWPVRFLAGFRDKTRLGWHPGDPGALIEVPSALFWERPRFRRVLNRLGSTYLGLNVHAMTPDSARAFLETMERHRPVYIRGIASGVDEYAGLLEAQGLEGRARGLGLRAITTCCEKLYPPHRERIERVFGTRVFDLYGCNEFGPMAMECSEHNGLHVAADTLVLEIVDTAGQPLPPGQNGRIVVTDPWNLGFALIRIDLGDVGSYLADERPCPCGVTFPRIAPVDGRQMDFIALPDGRRVHGLHFAGHLHKAKGVRQYRFVQERPDELALFIVGDPVAAEPQLAKVRGVTPPGMRLRIEFVDELPRTDRGKRLFVVSRMSQDRSP
jgi:phenylacetate-CoA ligase